MIDTSPEGLAALLRDVNQLVQRPEPPAELAVPCQEPERSSLVDGDPFGEWMENLPLRPWGDS